MTQPQRFCIAGVTGTHPLALARQLDARSLLQTYYTTLPKSRTSGVTSARTRRHRALLLPILASNRRWIRGRGNTRLQLWWGYEFDRWIAKRLEPGDVVHALPGCGLELRRAAKRRFGAMTVCDSGTSHERFLADLLDEETKKWGVPRHRGPESHLRYVEAEYDEADIITVPSGFARNSFVSMGVDPAKVRVTPYGAELRDYAPTTKRDDVFRILFVGTVCIRKGVQYLLEAVSQLKLPNAELCIRGADAPETAQLLRAYRGSIPLRRVEPAPRAAMKDLYSQASVFVLPSVEDGFGLVICQAMACGVPVIASRNSGGPDVITDGRDGVLVDARSSRAIRDHLLELYEHPAKRQAMGAAARRAIERVGGWSGYADSFIAACAPSSDRRAGL
jgi:glycosyltransferase involved in cell wall biosynthesis